MSSRILVEIICDECSYVETFVYLERNQIGSVACLGAVDGSTRRRGWTVMKYEDSDLLVQNFCRSCTERKRHGSKKQLPTPPPKPPSK